MKEIELSKLTEHPDNPRYIRDRNYKALLNSVRDFPDMLRARPLVVNKDMVVIGGNMRLRVLRDLKIKNAPVEVVDWTEEQQAEFMIKDNLQQGEFDWDLIANHWDQDSLISWGVDQFHFGISNTDHILPEDDDEYHERKESDQPKLTDGYVKIEFVVKEEEKKHIMKKVREYADQKDLQLGQALFAMLK